MTYATRAVPLALALFVVLAAALLSPTYAQGCQPCSDCTACEQAAMARLHSCTADANEAWEECLLDLSTPLETCQEVRELRLEFCNIVYWADRALCEPCWNTCSWTCGQPPGGDDKYDDPYVDPQQCPDPSLPGCEPV